MTGDIARASTVDIGVTRTLFFVFHLLNIKLVVKEYVHIYVAKLCSNQMWILKNSKELLDHLKSPNFNLITKIKSFDFSTLYTTIPHQKT